MILKIVLLLLVLGATTFPTNSMDDDKVFRLRSSERGKGAVYVFTDQASCFTTNVTLRSLSNHCTDVGIRMVVFLSHVAAIDFDRFVKRELGSGITVVNDEIGAYAKFYGVDNIPLLAVLGKNGEVLYEGVPGKSTFNVNEFVAAVDAVLKSDYEPTSSFYPNVNLLPFTKSKKLSGANTRGFSYATSMVRSANSGKYFLMHHPEKVYYSIDSNGNTGKVHSVQPPDKKYVSSTPFLVGVSDDTNTVFFYDTDLMSVQQHFLAYNSNTRTATYLSSPDASLKLAQRSRIVSMNKALCSRRITDGYTEFIVDTGIAAVFNGKSWNLIGKFDPYFFDTLTAQWWWAASEFVGDEVATHQNFTDYIDVWSTNGSSYKLPIVLPNDLITGTAWVDTNSADILRQRPIESKLAFRFRTHNLHYDASNNSLLLSIVSRRDQFEMPESDGEEYDVQSIIIAFDLNTRKQTSVSVLPINTVVHGAFDRKLFGVRSIDGQMYLIEAKYK